MAKKRTTKRVAYDMADGRFGIQMGRAVVPPEIHDEDQRAEWGLPRGTDEIGDYLVELNLLHKKGLQEASDSFVQIYKDVLGNEYSQGRQPTRIAKTYYKCRMTVLQWEELIERDERRPEDERAIYRIWPDFPVKPLMNRSMATIKADAAKRAYGAYGARVTWAVLDSGVNATHPHFGDPDFPERHTLLNSAVADLHRDFNLPDPEYASVDSPSATDEEKAKARAELLQRHRDQALTDELGHGTHVAGIIAGGLRPEIVKKVDVCLFERKFTSKPGGPPDKTFEERAVLDPTELTGVAPACRLISLKVLDAKGNGRSSDVIRALAYIRENLNSDPKLLRVHGVNLSVGYEFDAELFACGQSPLCVEVDRLVREGVVVVAAAGNTGYGRVQSEQRTTRVGLSNTINDPGNAELAITVGATHRDSPYTYGVSYFSSKGPTGDGRMKPDLVAPGERIVSCAAGQELASIEQCRTTPGPKARQKGRGLAAYLDMSGTSMAAPHVSGAIAAFLSIRREFIGKPTEVKRIFLSTATSLGRDKYLEGHGLADLMRAIQSV